MICINAITRILRHCGLGIPLDFVFELNPNDSFYDMININVEKLSYAIFLLTYQLGRYFSKEEGQMMIRIKCPEKLLIFSPNNFLF